LPRPGIALCDGLGNKVIGGIGDIVDYLVEKFSLAVVTMTSPAIAEFVKANYPGVEIRASVNMGIRTIQWY
jgi:hypothetical protein